MEARKELNKAIQDIEKMKGNGLVALNSSFDMYKIF